jgi:hypothetical protein
MFLSKDDNAEEIRKILHTKRFDCAVAFIGAMAKDLVSNAGSHSRVICNLRAGGTNPEAIRKMLRKGIRVKRCDLLHAKVYIGEATAVITSANLSANGLGLEGDELNGWLEAGYKVTDPAELSVIRRWFAELWDDGQHVSKDDITNAQKAWEERRHSRPTAGSRRSILETLEDNPEEFADRRIFIVISTASMSAEAEEAFKEVEATKKYGKNVDSYENWKELPEEAYFIDLYVGPRARAEYGGLWKSLDKKTGVVNFKYISGKRGTLFLCHKVKNIFGYRLTKRDRELLEDMGKKLLHSARGNRKKGGAYIPLLKAREILFSRTVDSTSKRTTGRKRKGTHTFFHAIVGRFNI